MSITCLPFAFDFQSSSAAANVEPLRLDNEVDVTGRPAESRGGLARLDVVDGHRPAERHLEMSVRVDCARNTYLPAASTTLSAETSSDSPINEMRPPST